jgi:parallel beta-helix repeat protein
VWRGIACWGVLIAVTVSVIPSALALTEPRTVPLADHAAIRIDGDPAFTAANGVTGGEGTASDPYTIEGWNISAAGGDAITILGTTAYFLVRNVTVHSGGQTYAGIRLSQIRHGRVENALFYDCGPALAIDASSDLSVTTNQFVSNYASAWVNSGTGLSFTGNEFRAGGGMVFSGSQWVNVTGNTAADPHFWVYTDPSTSGAHYNVSENIVSGIHTSVFDLRGIDDLVVEGNRLSSTGPGIVIQQSTNVSVYLNRVTLGAGVGIDVGESRHVVVSRNSVSNVTPGRGIDIALSSDVAVLTNDLRNNQQGIALQSNVNATADSNTVSGSGFSIAADTLEEYRSVATTGNTVNGLPFGIYRGCHDLVFDGAAVAQIFLLECRHITIRNETFKDLETGVTLVNVEDSRVESTLFRNSSSDAGLRVEWGQNITIARTNFTSNPLYGMRAWNTTNLRVLENTFRGNYIGLIISKTTNASLYHNNFIHNGLRPEEVVDEGTNGTRWDAGYPIGGNYWSYAYSVDRCSGVAQDVCGVPDGIADAPVTVGIGDADRYPLMRPYGIPSIPPVAQIDAPDDPYFRLTVTEVMDFNAWRSYDADGIILAYEWDFGDGMKGSGDYVTHAWSAEGLYNMTLTVRDNSNETASMSVQVNVTAPLPSAWVQVRPSRSVFVGQPVTFDGSQSDSNWGGISSWEWDFGDGTRGSGTVVVHQFVSPGTYSIQLTVTNRFAKTATATVDVVVSPIPEVLLRTYENPAGFRLPIPSNWSLQENVRAGDVTFAAVLTGPVHEGVTTNIVIDTGQDTTVREDNGYLASVVDGVVSSARSQSPGAFLSEGPAFRSIAGHAGVVFAITIPGPVPLVQKAALVVSAAHQRFWFFILTVAGDDSFLYNATFDRMVDGFEITLPAPINGLLLVVGLAAASAVGVVVIFVLVSRRRKSRARAFPAGGWTPPSGPVSAAHDQYCPACGRPSPLSAHFCSICGSALTLPPRSSPTWPPQPPREGT